MNYIPKVLKEVPFIIEDQELYKYLCDINGISLDSKDRYKTVYIVDFVIPQASLGVELDSYTYHTGRELIDNVRDQYLSIKFHLKIIRFNTYDFKRNLDLIKSLASLDRPLGRITYEESSNQYFHYTFSTTINRINRIKSYCIRTHKVIGTRGIILTIPDIQNLRLSLEQLSNLSNWMRKFYDEELIYLPINTDINSLISYYLTRKHFDQTYNTLKQLGYI